MATEQKLTAITVSEEFAQGYDAWAIREEPVEANPYEPKAKEYRRWNAGWYAARGEALVRESEIKP